jgi:hypothetical protein
VVTEPSHLMRSGALCAVLLGAVRVGAKRGFSM